ncbi:hypothetical protein FRC19_000116 [Serendipita sp. 401]|nr:hypothetical protein FRC19_000116 [Serendipita sp. 401]KAG9058821.1 hypothetical protein FS842_000018 [Serendipita sp. 407]
MCDYEEGVVDSTIEYKRLIVCCDGTNQSSISDREAKVPTNVTRFARALKCSEFQKRDGVTREIPQVVLYQTGVGTGGLTKISDTIAGAFGYGLDLHIVEAYSFFSHNFEKDDQLFLFGFSRGAFTARAIASVICNIGLLEKGSLQYFPMIYKRYKQRCSAKEGQEGFDQWLERLKKEENLQFLDEVSIHHLGVWDTVGSLGVPRTWISNTLNKIGFSINLNKKYEYHDMSFPIPPRNKRDKGFKGFIHSASQALSLDETRISFAPILLYCPTGSVGGLHFGHRTGFQQSWFPGVHTDVGGGYSRVYDDISDITLAWMIDRCDRRLRFKQGKDLKEELKQSSKQIEDPDSKAKTTRPEVSSKLDPERWAISALHNEANKGIFRFGGTAARTPGQYFLDKKDEQENPLEAKEYIHVSVRARMIKEPTWRPAALAGFTVKKDKEGKYNWHKVINERGKEPREIIIPEDGFHDKFNRAGLSYRLLSDTDKGLLDSDARNLQIGMVPEKKSWWTWSWFPWNWGRT